MRYALFIILFLCLFVFNMASAASMNISACGNLSNASMTYNLTNDISASGTCLQVNASNIIINCKNYTINSASGSGLTLGTTSSCFSNVTIKNCHFTGAGGINFANGYTYGGGCNCGYTVNDVIYNNTFNVTNTGMSFLCTKGLNATDNNIDVDTGLGVYMAMRLSSSGGRDYFDNITINAPLGIGFRFYYSYYATINHSSITAAGGIGINNFEHATEIIDYSIINASTGIYSFIGESPISYHSTIYASAIGIANSQSSMGTMNDGQIIATGTGTTLGCDNVAIWPYGGLNANNVNFTSVNSPAIKNGNIVYGIGCGNMINNSYIFSNNSNALVEYASGRYYNTIIASNTTNKSAIIVHNVIYTSILNNITVSSKGIDLQDESHNKCSIINMTFYGTGFPTTVTIINSSNHVNYTSGSLPFNYSVDNHKYLNISSGYYPGFWTEIRMYYTNDSSNESEWTIKGWDGYVLENLDGAILNITGKYVQGIVSYPAIFAILGNGTASNYTYPDATCAYYGNCTIGDECDDNSQCLSGICYDGHCVEGGGYPPIFINFIDVIVNILFGSASMIGFMLALAILAIGAYVGFRLAEAIGAIIVDIIILMVISFMPDPLLPWWLGIICLIAGIISAVYMVSRQRAE